MRTRLRGKMTLLFMAFALMVAIPAVALADDIANDLDATVDANVENTGVAAGGTKSVQYRVIPQNSDGKNGCNLTGSTVLKVSVASSDTSVATVSPSSLTFGSCSDTPSVTVTGVGAGTADITLTQTENTTEGSFNLDPAKFSVTVTNPAPPADTTAPDTQILTGPSGWINEDNATFTFSGEDNVTSGANLQYQHRLDGGAWSTASTSTSATYNNLSQGEHTFEVRAVDEAGNVDQSPASRTFSVDTIAPTLSPSVSPNPVLLNGSATATANAADTGGSGIASQSCDDVDTSSVGNKSVSCTATDNAGNINTASANYSVNYKFIGFSSPVDNPTVLNTVKAGQAIPLKWRLTDANGTAVTNLSNVAVNAATLSCSTGASEDLLEEVAAGASGLQNLGDGYYQFNWKSPTSYAKSCKTLTVSSTGLQAKALFNFTK